MGDVLDYPQGGLATTDKKIQENPAQVKRLLRSMVKSLIRIRQNRDELIAYIAKPWKMDPEFAASSYDTMLKAYSADGTTSAQSIQSVIDSIKGRSAPVSISQVVNFSLLEEVQREMKSNDHVAYRQRIELPAAGFRLIKAENLAVFSPELVDQLRFVLLHKHQFSSLSEFMRPGAFDMH
jgi:hypothetical protein